MISRDTQLDDLHDFLLGKQLGEGIHRRVFLYRPDRMLVMKVATECPNINVLEQEIWNSISEAPQLSKWFAPVISISECGIYMLQRRVFHKPKAEYPRMVPSFFGDLKYGNFGWIGDQFVCVDYAGFIATSMSHKWSLSMKKAEWWE